MKKIRACRAVFDNDLQTADAMHLYFACGLIPIAFLFDVLDGRVARWRKQSSAMGQELDSLADVISFGVAPAAIAYAWGMQGLFDRIVLLFFVVSGVSRLARYNVTAEKLSDGGDKVKYFEGTPIRTSLLLVVMLALAVWQGALSQQLWFGVLLIGGFQFHPLVLMFALSGTLMISRIRIPKLWILRVVSVWISPSSDLFVSIANKVGRAAFRLSTKWQPLVPSQTKRDHRPESGMYRDWP